MSNDQDIKAIIALETDQRSATETVRALTDIQEELIALAELNQEFANSTSSRTLTEQHEELATLAELNSEFIQSSISYLKTFEETANQIIAPMQDLEQIVEDIAKSTSNIAIPHEGLEELKEPTFSEHNRQYIAEQIAYLEQYQDAANQVVLPIKELNQAITAVVESTNTVSGETFREVTARIEEANKAGEDFAQIARDYNSDYYAEQIAKLTAENEQFQNTYQETIPVLQEVADNLVEVATNVDAIKIPRGDIFGPYIDSAQKLAEETRKASEEAKKIGADQTNQAPIVADKRSEEALKTIEATTKALDDLRKANIISKDAWNDASSSVWQLYDALNDVAKEINQLEQSEIDLHNADRVTQHRSELLTLQSTYESLRELLGSLPKELIEGLQEAARENEQLAQQLGKTAQATPEGIGSLRGNISTISTLSNRIGLGSAGDFRVAGDLIEVIDSLPDLKASITGIPSSIGSAVAAIGTPFGLGMLGAIGALSIGIKLFTDEVRRREEELAEARAKAKQESEDATQVGLSALDIYAQVMADGTVVAAEAALKNADRQLEIANTIDKKLSDITSNNDEMNYINFMGVYSQTQLGTELNLDLASQLASEGDEMFNYLLDAIEKIKPGLDAAGISVDEFIKNTDAGLNLIRDAQHENSLEMQRAESVINLVTGAVNSGVLALNSAEEMQRMITEGRLADAERARAIIIEEAQLSKASSAELENRLQILELEELALEKARGELIKFGEETEEVARQITSYSLQMYDNQRLRDKITNDYLDSARERELAAEIEKEMADTVIKYNRDAQAVRDQYERSRVASEQKLSDDLVRIEDRRIQQIERAQEQLAEREQAINLKASREEQDQATKLAHERQQQAVKVEREELKAEMDHARKVRDIREKSAQQETNLLLKRDFAGLFALRQRTDQEIKTAERASDEATKAREQARGEQAQDEMAKLAFEREQRQTRYQREIADAHAQAQRTQQQAQATTDRELQITRDKHNQQLRDLQDAKWRELGILKKGIHDEIALIESGSVSRVRAEMQTQSALRQAQQIGMMNRVNAQPIYQLPVGYTSRNSVVNNNNGNNTFNINGNNLSAMRQVVLNILEEIWSK